MSANRPDFRARDADHADQSPSLIKGTNSTLRKPRIRATSRISGSSAHSASASGRSATTRRLRTGQRTSDSGRGKLARSAASASGLVRVNAARCTASSTKRYTAVDKPPISRLARSAMASNTGCTSDGEAGDHLQDVGRRGLPLQRLLRLVEQPHILDGDHCLVGEGLQQLDVVIGETPGSARVTLMKPMERPSLISGT